MANFFDFYKIHVCQKYQLQLFLEETTTACYTSPKKIKKNIGFLLVTTCDHCFLWFQKGKEDANVGHLIG